MSQESPGFIRVECQIFVDIDAEVWAEGGYGLVFAGPCRLHGGQWLVLKMLRDDVFEDDPTAYDRFVREALVWVGLWPHSNLIQAKAVTFIKGVPFLILEYANEGHLRQNLRADVPFSLRFVWAQMIAAGLHTLHIPDRALMRASPIVRRDLKPENVLIRDGFAKITDFGLAKVAGDKSLPPNPAINGKQLVALPTMAAIPAVTQHGASIGVFRSRARADDPQLRAVRTSSRRRQERWT